MERWKLYFSAPKEPDVYLTKEEMTWWDTIAAPVRSRTFVQALSAVFLGMFGGRFIMAVVRLATGAAAPEPMSKVSLVFAGIMGGFATLMGWYTLLTTRQKQMIRSRRLRAAMKRQEPTDDAAA